MARRPVSSADAPPAIGPYSQGIRTDRLLFLSGQIPLDATGALIGSDITTQTTQVLHNLSALLAAAGASFADVLRTTVYLVDLGEFDAMNAVYATRMPDPPPARSTVQVSRLPRDARVEIDLIALLQAPDE